MQKKTGPAGGRLVLVHGDDVTAFLHSVARDTSSTRVRFGTTVGKSLR